MSKTAGRTGRGEIKTDKGRYPNGKPHRFYLGFDPREGEIRKARLEQLWQCVERQEGHWTPFTIALGKAIAKGLHEVTVDEWVLAKSPDSDQYEDVGPNVAANIVTRLQSAYPVIRLVVGEPIAKEHERIGKKLQQEAEALEAEAQAILGKSQDNQTLHQALDDFRQWVEDSYREVGTEKLKPSGKRLMYNILTLKKHHVDVPLCQFNLKAIEDMEDYWKRRPKIDRSPIAAAETCREQIKLIRKFITWLNKNELFTWRKPSDYTVRRMKIEPTSDELAQRASPEQVKRYKLKELKILWEYATPLERLLFCLGLNCGFGAAEIRSLYRSEIQGDYIKRVRRKTLVYGEWQLWEITKKAIEWYLAHRRPQSDDPHLILTRNGKDLSSSENGNNNPSINNWWNALTCRIKKDEENKDFRKLSFNKLRKTSGNLIRKIAGGETMKIFHARGKPVETDCHSEVYSNRPFRKVFKAVRIMGEKIAPIFASVADPFPAKQSKPHMTPGQHKRLKALRKQGYTLVKIGEIMGCSDETVRKYLRRP